MKFQVISDIHIEYQHFELLPVDNCDVLLLAGDIGDPKTDTYVRFITKASSVYTYVFIVAGNHECYGSSVPETHDLISTICDAFHNVIFLNRTTFQLTDTLRIIGATLWSSIQDDQIEYSRTRLMDFRSIDDWSPEEHNRMHGVDLAFIHEEILRATREGVQLIVLTHHAPMVQGTSRPEYNGCLISSTYASDLSHIIKHPVVAWVYGHTHHSKRCIVNNVHLLSNQYGKASEATGFDPSFVFHV